MERDRMRMDGPDRKQSPATTASVCRDLLRGDSYHKSSTYKYSEVLSVFCVANSRTLRSTHESPKLGLLWCGLDVASRTRAELVEPKTLGPVQRYSGARLSCPNIAHENCTSTVPRAKYVLSRDPDGQAG